MGVSLPDFKDVIKEFIDKQYGRDSTILDVGAGAGAYQKLLSYANMDAVEIFEPYIKEFNLDARYRKVIRGNICELVDTLGFYDVTIFGDVLEHLTVNDAQHVLAALERKCRCIIISIPYEYKQSVVNNNEHERHLQSDLTHERFVERYPEFRLFKKNYRIGVYIWESA